MVSFSMNGFTLKMSSIHTKKPASGCSGFQPNYLLLVIDNYYSHWELSFIEYLDQYDISQLYRLT